MNKNASRILAILMAICMVISLVPAVMATESDTVEILMLDTSDIHGQLYATDYTADASASGTYRQGLTRVATYVKEMREKYPNFFLADTGDTIQGTPLTYYFAFEEHTMEDPTVKALRTMGYDMWVLGNHEFNYGMTVLNEQVNYAISEATEGETPITMSMANYLAAETNNDETKDWATWRGFEPYVIREYDGVKVAIMGIGNPGVPQWDVPENWEGIYFANPIETYDHYEAEMLEKSDVIVLMSHSGIDIEGDGTGYIRQLIEGHDSVDLVFSGHEHRDGVTMIKDATGKEIPVVSPSTKCNKIGQALITYNKADGSVTVAAENVSMRNYAIDAELEAVLKPYEEAAWNEYMLQPIGKASGDFTASGLGDGPSAFMDLINQVQLAYAYDYNGQNTPDDPSDDEMAQLSISAPLTSGDAANIIPEGDIVLGDLFRLYRYENWFYQITMTGKEVKTWLEFAATNVDENGKASNLTYYDVIYGDGFYYEINAKAPEGKRITKMTYDGVDVTDDQVFTVVVNNYRYNGGGNYVKYLNEHGCEFIANDPDRIIYSTQYDMIQGEDQGQARNMLANYIREHEVIDPEITSTWKIVTERSYNNPFTDVSEENYFYVPVMELVEMGIIKGMTETTFEPELILNRGQWVTMLYRAVGEPEVTEPTTFTDVLPGSYWADAFAWAEEAGVVKGVGGGKAAPEDQITREQMVTMLYRAAGEPVEAYDLSGYVDVNDISYYAVDAFEWSVANGIIKGMTEDTLGPQGCATRAQAATVIYRILTAVVE